MRTNFTNEIWNNKNNREKKYLYKLSCVDIWANLISVHKFEIYPLQERKISRKYNENGCDRNLNLKPIDHNDAIFTTFSTKVAIRTEDILVPDTRQQHCTGNFTK